MNVERSVRLIAGIVVLITVAAGYWISPWFLLLTALMGANLLQSGFTNWCPMMPVLRMLGVEDSGRRIRPSVIVETVSPSPDAASHEQARIAWLRIFLRVVSVGMLAAFIPWITLILLNAPVLGPGGVLAPLLRFQPYNAHYETMLTAIHIVWAILLWRASTDPANNLSLIDFTIGANAAHGLVMVVVTPMQKGALMAVVEGLPLLIIAAALMWLRPVRSMSSGPPQTAFAK